MLWRWTTPKHAGHHAATGEAVGTAFLAHLRKTGLEMAGPDLADWYYAARDAAQDRQPLMELAEANPGIATRLLRLASTAPTGRIPPAHNLTEAFDRLGTGRVFETAAMALTRKVFLEGEAVSGGELGEFWRHGVAVGILLRCLCEQMEEAAVLPPGQAFLAGLLHDIGLSAQCRLLGAVRWRMILDGWRGGPGSICELEREQTGVAHPEIGARLLEYWGIDPEIAGAVAMHHEVAADLGFQQGGLAWLLHLADWVCVEEELGFADVGISEAANYSGCQAFLAAAPAELRQAVASAATELAWLERLGFVSRLHLRLSFAAAQSPNGG
ncbi:MAG: HDOD domain-containing protein [Lentisphaeria bacterium]